MMLLSTSNAKCCEFLALNWIEVPYPVSASSSFWRKSRILGGGGGGGQSTHSYVDLFL